MSDEITKVAEPVEGGKKGVSRREFIGGVGGVGLGLAFGGFISKFGLVGSGTVAMAASGGYLLVDTKKCAGCETCMLACATAHTGRSNISLSRIQVTADYMKGYPFDMEQVQCRQCPYPACVAVCPTGANHVSEENGGVRMVDEDKCIGCERCVEACPFTPSRMQWNHEDRHAQKCDLCANTPHWNEDGGIGGKQACVEMCPMKAISFTTEVPEQDELGYITNMRNTHWGSVLLLDPTDLGQEPAL